MRPVLSVLVWVLLGVGCRGELSGPDREGMGSLRFDYQGVISGSYHVRSPAQVDTSTAAQYVIGRREPIGVVIFSRDSLSTPSPMRIQLRLDQRIPGNYAISRLCDIGDTVLCASGWVELGRDPAGGARRRLDLASGVVTVTAASGGRLRGSLAGTARRLPGQTMQIERGEFDVPLSTN